MSKDQTITVTVKPEIDREAVEEAAQLAAALFLSSFAVAVLEGVAAVEPPEEVLARVKAETLEKAASLRPWEMELLGVGEGKTAADAIRAASAFIPPVGSLGRPDPLPGLPEANDLLRELRGIGWDVVRQDPLSDGQESARSDVQPPEASQGTPTAADVPGPAQTLADLTPCLGDRVRAVADFSTPTVMTYAWYEDAEGYYWMENPGGNRGWYGASPNIWTVLEHLDPVPPEEPPVGAGMLVSERGYLWRRGEHGWQTRLRDRWTPDGCWDGVLMDGRLRPATPADLAAHGVDEQGEPVGKGEWSVKTDEAGDRILMRNGVQVADEAAAERPEDFTILVDAFTGAGER